MARDLKIVTLSLRILDTFDESCCGINDHLKNFFEVSKHDVSSTHMYKVSWDDPRCGQG